MALRENRLSTKAQIRQRICYLYDVAAPHHADLVAHGLNLDLVPYEMPSWFSITAVSVSGALASIPKALQADDLVLCIVFLSFAFHQMLDDPRTHFKIRNANCCQRSNQLLIVKSYD